ncbi:hypothetical protein CFP56_024053 [Quercus suber]|uniref:Reverse transcriptase zinc-binding domain-containing protein n=1 Tax=Quercus suber TaxID=58331 RepID=A0AAW0K8C7_QUESU
MPSSDGPRSFFENLMEIRFMMEDKHENLLTKPFNFHRENMKTSLLSRLTSIGNTGFQDLIVMSLTILRIMVFDVMSFAIKMSSPEQLISWFGGSSSLISLQEHFSVRGQPICYVMLAAGCLSINGNKILQLLQSGYQVCLRLVRDIVAKGGNIGCSDPSKLHSVWRGVWRLNMPKKIKHFVWKACNGILPTKDSFF